MTVRDIIKAQWEASQRGALAVWTIYDRPKDHPEGYIARLFEVAGETVATEDTMTDNLDGLRAAFERAGLVKLPRQAQDAPHIVESWI